MNILRRRMLAQENDNPFGDGSLGNVTISNNQTWFTDTEDIGVIEKQYVNLTINSNVTVSAGNRNSGIILRVRGNCTINGNLVNKMAPKSHNADLSAFYPIWLIQNGRAGNGDQGGNCMSGTTLINRGGYGQAGRFYGGGTSGGGASGRGGYRSNDFPQIVPGLGADGGDADGITVNTGFLIGAQAVSGRADQRLAYNDSSFGIHNGGRGMYGGGSSAGLGLRNGYYPDYRVRSSGKGGSNGGNADPPQKESISYGSYCVGGSGGSGIWGGGVIIIFCAGILTIGNTASIDVSGNVGGLKSQGYDSNPSATMTHYKEDGADGGKSGGGRIYLLSAGTMTRNGTFNVKGGGDGSANTNGDRYWISYSDYRKGQGVPNAF